MLEQGGAWLFVFLQPWRTGKRQKTDWDEWQSLPDEFDDANKEDIVKAARSMKADGMAVEKIEKYTGLTAEEIEGL